MRHLGMIFFAILKINIIFYPRLQGSLLLLNSAFTKLNCSYAKFPLEVEFFSKEKSRWHSENEKNLHFLTPFFRCCKNALSDLLRFANFASSLYDIVLYPTKNTGSELWYLVEYLDTFYRSDLWENICNFILKNCKLPNKISDLQSLP